MHYRKSNLFTNPVIDQNTQFPREIAHEDYKYLITGEGPLVNHHKAPFAKSNGGGSNKSSSKINKVVLSVEKKKFGGVRICQWCFKTKPDRCHHCS